MKLTLLLSSLLVLICSFSIFNNVDNPNSKTLLVHHFSQEDSLKIKLDTTESPNKGNFIIRQPDYKILYSSHINKIEVGFLKGCAFDYSLEFFNCDTAIYVGPSTLLVIPNDRGYVYINVYDETDPNHLKLVHTAKFHIRTKPRPVIRLGSGKEEHAASWKSNNIFASYPPDQWLRHRFTIRDWIFKINGRKYKGYGNKITEQVKQAIKKRKINERFELEVDIADEMGQINHYKTFFLRGDDKNFLN